MHTPNTSVTKAWMGLLLLAACTGNKLRLSQDASPELEGGSLTEWPADAGSVDRGAPAQPEVAVEAGAASASPDVPASSEVATDSALAAVDVPRSLCGNGWVDPGEVCDDGNTASGDGCSASCRLEDWDPCVGRRCVRLVVCGDATLGGSETCDDGNVASGDGCSADCQRVEPGWMCRVPGRKCAPICGDGRLTGWEACDDGNIKNGDGCRVRCQTEPGWDCSSGTCVQVSSFDGGVDSVADLGNCGDGVLSWFEECDNGAANGDTEYGGCTTYCTFGPYCGDGQVNGPELCDLGDLNGKVLGKDGCTIGCTKPHFCGDAAVDAFLGEECDLGPQNGVKLDRNDNPTDDPNALFYCDENCRIAVSIVL